MKDFKDLNVLVKQTAIQMNHQNLYQMNKLNKTFISNKLIILKNHPKFFYSNKNNNKNFKNY